MQEGYAVITFCFDEQGQFEKKNSRGLFIGGFMFDDCGYDDETDREKERIISFLKRVCEEAESTFPKDLHSNNDRNPAVKETKILYNSHLSEFIKSGLYDGKTLTDKERRGKYTFLFEYDSENEKYKDQYGIWVSDDKGSNKYDHMVADFICNSLFYNPILNEEIIKMDFPTRIVISDNQETFIKKGHDTKNEIIFDTNNDYFRTLLTELTKKNKDKKINLDELSVRSITKAYGLNEEEDADELKEYAFLLLADVVCSVTDRRLKGRDNMIILESFYKNEMNSECLIYNYSSLEGVFRDAYDNAQKGLILATLKNSYLLTAENKKANYYAFKWSPYVLSVLSNIIQDADINKAMKLFADTYSEYTKEEAKYISNWFRDKAKLDGENICLLCDVMTNGLLENAFRNVLKCIDEDEIYKSYFLLYSIETRIPDKDELIIQGITYLYERIDEVIDETSFSRLVKEVNEYTFKAKISVELKYISDKAINLYKKHGDSIVEEESILFYMYDSAVALCNHSGETKENAKYLPKIEKYKKYVDSSEYNKRVNRYIVAQIDLLNFDEAFVLSRNNTIDSGKRGKLKRIEIGEKDITSKEHAKALSQFAQICAFMNRSNSNLVENGVLSETKFEDYKDFIEGLFKMSLKKFKNGSDDYLITLNYLMHYYLMKIDELSFIKEYEESARILETEEGKKLTKSAERKVKKAKELLNEKRQDYEKELATKEELKQKYIECARIYFNGKEAPKNQLEYILSLNKKSKINPVFALFLWSKSLLIVYEKDQVKEALSDEELVKLLTGKYVKYHPWELTSTHLAKAFHSIGDSKNEKHFFEMIDLNTDSDLLNCICKNSKLKYYTYVNNEKMCIKAREDLSKELVAYTKGRIEGNIDNIITYTYC